jgi:hypothetical protein
MKEAKTVNATSPATFEKMLNLRLSEGWEINGAMQVLAGKQLVILLTREKKEDNNGT